MKYLFKAPLICLLMANSWAADFTRPTSHSKSYLLVAVSGFKTGRQSSESENIYSNKIGKGAEDSGAWTNINTNHPKIFKTVYLTHYSKDSEINSVLKLTENSQGACKKDQGLIMMVNSWGAKISQKLAKLYFKKCGILPHLTILIDGVSKPTPFPYDKPIMALNCINFYQRSSSLQGISIENCKNIELTYNNAKIDLFSAHIHAEWDASARAKLLIQDYLNGRVPVLFLQDEEGIDTLKGL